MLSAQRGQRTSSGDDEEKQASVQGLRDSLSPIAHPCLPPLSPPPSLPLSVYPAHTMMLPLLVVRTTAPPEVPFGETQRGEY